MGRWMRGLGGLVLLAALGCGPAADPDDEDPTGIPGDDDDDTEPREVSFSEDIVPLFERSACYDCHYDGTPTHYDLTRPFDPDVGIVGRENSWVPNGSTWPLVVDPGNAAESFLVIKLSGIELDPKVDGGTMPMHLEPLTTSELAAVETWISNGAHDDAQFASAVAPIFGTEISMRKAAGRCTYCHYPGSPSGLNVLDVFDPVEGMVGVDSAYGGKIVVPGDPDASVLMGKLRGLGPGKQMPLHAPPFTPSQIQLVIDWIDAGALDN